MTTALAPRDTASALDPRLAAFLAPNCPEVFHSVATSNSIWQADPYDIETIHAEARASFDRLLMRGSHTPAPPSGAVQVLLGEAGSGKTHLMRAFRTRAHSQGWGYCGYLQMTTEATNYARYMLTNLIDGLEQPYAPDGPSRSGLARLSTALLELVPGLHDHDREMFREGNGDATKWVDDYADRLKATERMRSCDLELLRVVLHLERIDPRVHSRALMWLRCQKMKPEDCDWIGGTIPRDDDSDPMRTLQQLARLVDAIHGVPLVLLIDQLEDMANQSAPTERFLKVVDAVTALTDSTPNSVVVFTCLEDYFNENVGKLTKSKQDRLIRDPETMRLSSARSFEEICSMTARRLAYLYDTAEVALDPNDELYPFREEHLERLNNLRARDVLDLLRRHHQHCIVAKRWEEPDGVAPPPPPPPVESELDQLWNDFHSGFQKNVPDSEEELARILDGAIRAASDELPQGYHFGCASSDGRYLEIETHKPNNTLEKRLAAVCNANTRGPAFGKQISELEKRAGEIPVALVRTTDFPKSGKAIAQIAQMLKRYGEKVVVADSEWRRMLAFDDFRTQHRQRPDFGSWQKEARPLGQLNALQKILRLNECVAMPPDTNHRPSSQDPQPRIETTPPSDGAASTSENGKLDKSLVLGNTCGLSPQKVTFEPNELVQHAAFLGGSGSGKTTAALNLLEQLLSQGVPAVLLDRKGDLCRYADPTAWNRPLDDPKREAARRTLRQKLDVALYTPGEPKGRPLSLPIVPTGFDQLPEAERERFAQYAAAALGSMIGFKSSDADKGQRAILAKAIETLASVPGAAITLPRLREVIDRQDDALLNAIGGGYPEKYYSNLAQRLLTLELNNKQLLNGEERLDLDALLGTGSHAVPERVRLSIISTRFLGDAAKVDFWVSQLLVAVSRWCAKSPKPHLQAVFLFDEADIYLPAGNKQPATKAPMEDLLKRARSAGVGLFLATQSPGDFEYKCKENVRTWLIGRVKEPRALEKLKPMLEAAKGNPLSKLPSQATGEFYLVRESSVMQVRSDESFVRTEQLAEDQIVQLAARLAPRLER